MHLPRYQLTAAEGLYSYEFISEGPKGRIVKLIQFTLVNREDIYNLGFGDKDPLTGDMDDEARSDNGDSEKVLRTVVSAVFAFFDQRPEAWIFAIGSTTSRTRLYQIGISRHFDYISQDLDIYGQIDDAWFPFETGRVYDAFLVKLKAA